MKHPKKVAESYEAYSVDDGYKILKAIYWHYDTFESPKGDFIKVFRYGNEYRISTTNLHKIAKDEGLYKELDEALNKPAKKLSA